VTVKVGTDSLATSQEPRLSLSVMVIVAQTHDIDWEVSGPWSIRFREKLRLPPVDGKPYCCYRNTVILFEQPYRETDDGTYAELGRCETHDIKHPPHVLHVPQTPHGYYEVMPGHVERAHDGGWLFVREARANTRWARWIRRAGHP
jgi:hypothetical protein